MGAHRCSSGCSTGMAMGLLMARVLKASQPHLKLSQNNCYKCSTFPIVFVCFQFHSLPRTLHAQHTWCWAGAEP